MEELKNLITEREGQIREIEKEIEEYQRQIDQKIGEASTLKNEIKRLETVVKKLNADIRLTQRKLNSSELAIEKLGIEIGEKTSDIAGRKKELAAILREFSEAESDSLAETLLKHKKLSDFFTSLQYLENLEAAIGSDLEALKILKLELEERQAEEKTAKERLENLATELEDRRAIQTNTQQSKNQLLAATKNKEVEYQKLLREREKKRAEITEEIRKTEDELRLLVDPSSLPLPRPGILAWPVQIPKITQGFGKTTFSESAAGDVYGKNGHNGIDLKAAIGTPILAAEEGKIKGTGNSDTVCPGGSYGKWIVIEHPNKLATLYAHLSLIRTSAGQEVTRGEIIGYSGDTGYTTGPHLHFTVYDARTVEVKASRVCGFLPYGGYIDPMIYL